MPIDTASAVAHLIAVEPKFAPIVERHGPIPPGQLGRPGELFEHLLKAIVYQQLSGKAAATIHGRVVDQIGGKKPDPARLLSLPDEPLRGAGLSAAKLLAARDLAARVTAGTLPTMKQLARLSDDEIVATVTQVRGVGSWTAQMLLMFTMARPDVLPVLDLGIRKGFAVTISNRVAKAKDGLPSPEAVAKRGQAWAPWRTVASWYLWRSLE